MTISDLSAEAIEKINACQWDRIIEKHEGPEEWKSVLAYYEPEFLEIAGRPVLLPIRRDRHPNISVLRVIVSDDSNSLTVFLKDTTFSSSPDYEMFDSGFLAVCDKVAGEEFYLAVVYHEWFIFENALTAG